MPESVSNVRPSFGPDTGKNVLGRTYFLDANAFIELENNPSTDTTMGFVYQAFIEGWIGVVLTDTTAVERVNRFGPDLGDKEPSLWAFESHGPLVLGHSRLGSCVLGGDEDDARMESIFRILKPGKPTSELGKNDFRDGLQINTTLRYGGSNFVTRDKNILKRSSQLFDTFGLKVLTPDDVRESVLEAINSSRARELARGNRMWLPSWPTAEELSIEN